MPDARIDFRLDQPVRDLELTDIAGDGDELELRLDSPSDPAIWLRIRLPVDQVREILASRVG